MSKLERIVYPIFEVKNIEKWKVFADHLYGLPLQKNKATGNYEMIIDDTGCRLIFRQGKANDIVTAGWQSGDPQELFNKLEAEGHNPAWASKELTAARGAQQLFTVVDPSGLTLEIFDEAKASLPVDPSCHGLEFEAGELGFGHITLISKNYDDLEAFYCQQLGMGVSDYIDWEIVKGYPLHLGFFHANPRHHSLAAGRMSGLPRRLHHFMLQVKDRHQVGMSFDRIRQEGVKVMNEIGVHPNDKSFSFYVKTPSGFEAELGTEGIAVDTDDTNREIKTYDRLSMWGHKMAAQDAVPLKVLATVKKLTEGAKA